jgi:hypothetical protein
VKRKRVGVMYNIKRVTPDSVYQAAYDREIGRGACSLYADLMAWVDVAWTFCKCAKCGHFTSAPRLLVDMVPEEHEYFPLSYVMEHLKYGEVCRTADELQRMDNLYWTPRGQGMGLWRSLGRSRGQG